MLKPLIKQLGVQVRLHDIIYHAIDDVKVSNGRIASTKLPKRLIKVKLSLKPHSNRPNTASLPAAK